MISFFKRAVWLIILYLNCLLLLGQTEDEKTGGGIGITFGIPNGRISAALGPGDLSPIDGGYFVGVRFITNSSGILHLFVDTMLLHYEKQLVSAGETAFGVYTLENGFFNGIGPFSDDLYFHMNTNGSD